MRLSLAARHRRVRFGHRPHGLLCERRRWRGACLVLGGVLLALIAPPPLASAQSPEAPVITSGEDPFARVSPGEEGEDGAGFGTADLFFEPEKLRWTPVPGAFELDLKRRNANPLYSKARQIVTEADLRQAKIQDAEDAWALLETFIELQSDAKRFARLETKPEIEAVIDQLGAAIQRGMEIGGHGVRMAAGLRTLRDGLLEGWRSAGDASVAGSVVALERSGALDPPATRDAFVAQLLREDGPIREDEQASAILSEAPTTIALAMGTLSRGRKRQVQVDAGALVQGLDSSGLTLADRDAKLDALFEGDANLRRRVLQTRPR